MAPRNVLVWMLLPVLVVLTLSAGAQAQELREVPASEILEQIQAGEDVHLENVRITGEFNLGSIELETVPVAWDVLGTAFYGLETELKTVESEITIRNSVFETDVNCQNTQFRECFNFQNTSFLGKTDFNVTIFGGDTYFEDARFVGDAHFEDARFGGVAYFVDVRFVGDANFRDANFVGYAQFDDVRFVGDAHFEDARFGISTYFYGAIFGGDTYFLDANFGGDTYFLDANFGGDTYFLDASFGGDTYFLDASFGGDADFEYAIFGGDVDFGGVSFGGVAYFVSVRFGGDVDFSDARFGGVAYFRDVIFGDYAIFNSTEFNKLSFYNTTFTNVSLHGADFKRMSVNWTSLKDVLVFDGPTYINLIKNFRELEQFEDADDACYQYRRLSQANKKWSFSKLGDIFMWLSCGYGVKPQYTIILAVAIILILALIYWSRNGIRRLKEWDEGDNQDVFSCDILYFIMVALTVIGFMWLSCSYGVKPHYTAILAVAIIFIFGHIYRLGSGVGKQDVSFCDAFYFSVSTFTTIGYGDWYPKNYYRVLAAIEGLVGWLILALFLVTLANVMIRP